MICQELEDQLCRVMGCYRVVPMQGFFIIQELNLAWIWMTLPCDIMLLMCYIVGVVNLLDRLRDFYHHKPPPPPPPPPSCVDSP